MTWRHGFSIEGRTECHSATLIVQLAGQIERVAVWQLEVKQRGMWGALRHKACRRSQGSRHSHIHAPVDQGILDRHRDQNAVFDDKHQRVARLPLFQKIPHTR